MPIKEYQKDQLAKPTGIKWELQDIFRVYSKDYLDNNSASNRQKKVMGHIRTCRTSVLGGHVEACKECGCQRNAYNSCRDRH